MLQFLQKDLYVKSWDIRLNNYVPNWKENVILPKKVIFFRKLTNTTIYLICPTPKKSLHLSRSWDIWRLSSLMFWLISQKSSFYKIVPHQTRFKYSLEHSPVNLSNAYRWMLIKETWLMKVSCVLIYFTRVIKLSHHIPPWGMTLKKVSISNRLKQLHLFLNKSKK